ncbi:VanZ family protein [Jeotgalibacillus sp. ET6]|uniref:VanZ family protein n=1 Tax=Jeotgalibacillus sp. ET6 TaxID=3037260 RepID=UPI002418AEDE|nr:VanZ family protein [Jeotgalibacillus sp. ET6]MDG5471204.1 VanZ family protein [Jeotgalibacillus sp. ET6]
MKKWVKIFFTALPFLYMSLIWFLSDRPSDTVLALQNESLDLFIKESLHLVEFGILHFLFIAALLAHGKLTTATHTAAAVFAAFYGLLDEIHQAFVPSRSATVIDAIKDLIGVIIVYVVIQRAYFVQKNGWVAKRLQRFEMWFKAN